MNSAVSLVSHIAYLPFSMFQHFVSCRAMRQLWNSMSLFFLFHAEFQKFFLDGFLTVPIVCNTYWQWPQKESEHEFWQHFSTVFWAKKSFSGECPIFIPEFYTYLQSIKTVVLFTFISVNIFWSNTPKNWVWSSSWVWNLYTSETAS